MTMCMTILIRQQLAEMLIGRPTEEDLFDVRLDVLTGCVVAVNDHLKRDGCLDLDWQLLVVTQTLSSELNSVAQIVDVLVLGVPKVLQRPTSLWSENKLDEN